MERSEDLIKIIQRIITLHLPIVPGAGRPDTPVYPPMLEVADKKDRSHSTNDVDDGDNLAACWLR